MKQSARAAEYINWGSRTSLQGCCRCILQPQPTGPSIIFAWCSMQVKVKLATVVEGGPEGLRFNSYYTEVLGRALLLSLDWSTLPLIRTL